MSRRNKSKPRGETAPPMTTDAFSNPLFRLGVGAQSPLEATEYVRTAVTDNYAMLNTLYRENWIVQNVVGIIPDDMTREWFRVTGGVEPARLAALEQVQRRTQLRARINEGLRWGRLYGGAAGLILLRGQRDLSKPLDYDAVLPGSFVGLYIFDRWSGISPSAELVTEVADPDFGLPMYYTINTPDGSTVARVHHSRIVRFCGRELPYLERLKEQFWGESEVEALYRDVVKHDNVAENMAALTFRANVDTMEVQNLDQLFSLSSTEQQRRFWATMQAQSVMRSNFGLQLVNRGDRIENTQYTFTGLSDVYASMCLDLSGASRIPATKLFGRSPEGMNATGESDLQNYYDYVGTLRESVLRPILERLLPILCLSAWGGVAEDAEITFPPLWTPTAREVAEIAKAKAETIVNAYTAGLLTVGTAQKELRRLSDETGLFGEISDEEIAANAGKTYRDVTALCDPLAGLTLGAGEEDADPFDAAARDSWARDYAPSQPRDDRGRWTSGGGGDDEKPTGITKNARGEDTLDSAERARYNKAIVGAVTVDGYEVRRIHGHAYDRIAQRSYSPGEILDCLRNAAITYPGNTGNRMVYQHGRIKTIYDIDAAMLITVMWRDEG